MTDKADEPGGAIPEPTELSALEEATTPKEKEASIPAAPEAEEASTEQLPPPPRRWFSRAEPEPALPKAEEMYNQIAAWYHEPENAALRAAYGKNTNLQKLGLACRDVIRGFWRTAAH